MSEATALVTVEHAAPRALITKEVLKYEAEQRRMLAEYVQQQMKEGTDYGTIPGTPKPTLLKPGAEKLVTLFRCTPKFALLEKQSTQDFDKGFFNYVFRCRIYSRDVGAVVAEGYGSANSYESRYRWRNGSRKCPVCGKEAIIQGKAEYGGGWVCFKKKDGCGAKFNAADPTITGQQVGRVENPDLPDMANTVLKMAKKRALVDASIALARCSDMFTQDVEDLGPEAPPEDMGPPPLAREEKPAPRQQSERRAEPQRAQREARPAEVTNFPKGGQPLTSEQQAKAEKVAAQLGGQVVPPSATEPDSEDEALADAIVAEAEAAQSETDIRALSANAKKLPDGPLKARAGAALKAACQRLNIPLPKKSRQPGEEG